MSASAIAVGDDVEHAESIRPGTCHPTTIWGSSSSAVVAAPAQRHYGAAVPAISVIIPVRDGAETIIAQLSALSNQVPGTPNFEVIVADNGSTDGTAALVDGFAAPFPLKVVGALDRPGVSHARNVGVAAATGQLLLVCDADDEVHPNWVEAFAEAHRRGALLMGGTLDYTRLSSTLARAWRASERTRVMQHLGFLPFAHGACCAFDRAVFDAIGGFDEGLLGGGDDVDFSWRAQLAGFSLDDVPEAVVDYRLREGLRDMCRQSWNYGRADPALYARHRHNGMPPRTLRSSLKTALRIAVGAPALLMSTRRRGAWLWFTAHKLGRVRGSFQHRVFYV